MGIVQTHVRIRRYDQRGPALPEATCQVEYVNLALLSSAYQPDLDTFDMLNKIGLNDDDFECHQLIDDLEIDMSILQDTIKIQ